MAVKQQIIAKTIDFGASDDPMKANALAEHQLLQFPAIIGGTVPVVNIPEIKAGALKLSGEVIAEYSSANPKNGTIRRLHTE